MAIVGMTDRWVSGVAAKDGKRTEYRDKKVRGLLLRVTPKGEKSWAVLYRRSSDGKRRRYTIGSYPEFSLQEARKKALDITARVAREEDPAGEKQERRKAESFEELAMRWLERHAKVKKRSWREDEKRLAHDLLPCIGGMKAAEVTKRDIIRAIDIVADRGALYQANRVLTLARTIYNWALAEDLLDVNPTLGIRKRIDEKPRERVLSDAEIECLWNGLDRARMTEGIRLIIRLALLTGQRIGEICGIRKSEIDLNNGVWELPGARTKNGRSHRVPLSGPAMALLKRARELSGGSPFLFPSPKHGQSINPQAPSRALNRAKDVIGVKDVRIHDLRRTVTSGMARLGVAREVISKVLNHVSGDNGITGRVYDRYSYDDEKRQALQEWGDYVMKITGAASKEEKHAGK